MTPLRCYSEVIHIRSFMPLKHTSAIRESQVSEVQDSEMGEDGGLLNSYKYSNSDNYQHLDFSLCSKRSILNPIFLINNPVTLSKVAIVSLLSSTSSTFRLSRN